MTTFRSTIDIFIGVLWCHFFGIRIALLLVFLSLMFDLLFLYYSRSEDSTNEHSTPKRDDA